MPATALQLRMHSGVALVLLRSCTHFTPLTPWLLWRRDDRQFAHLPANSPLHQTLNPALAQPRSAGSGTTNGNQDAAVAAALLAGMDAKSEAAEQPDFLPIALMSHTPQIESHE